MSIESSRRNGIDGKWIRENETKEFEYGYTTDTENKTSYQRAVKMLALEKIKNELIFSGMLEAQLRAFARDGIVISREQLISDINKEVARQSINHDLESKISFDESKTDTQRSDVEEQIDRLKNDLGSIFGEMPTKSITASTETDYSEQSRDLLINDILQSMEEAGEFTNIPPEDVSQRIDAMSTVKKRLQEKSIDELEILLDSYILAVEKKKSSGTHR